MFDDLMGRLSVKERIAFVGKDSFLAEIRVGLLSVQTYNGHGLIGKEITKLLNRMPVYESQNNRTYDHEFDFAKMGMAQFAKGFARAYKCVSEGNLERRWGGVVGSSVGIFYENPGGKDRGDYVSDLVAEVTGLERRKPRIGKQEIEDTYGLQSPAELSLVGVTDAL